MHGLLAAHSRARGGATDLSAKNPARENKKNSEEEK